MNKKAFLKGLHHGMPIGLGYISVSFAFGIAAVVKGAPAWLPILLSMTNLTSAGQFAGLDLMMAGTSFAEIVLTQCVINLRYALMSVSLSQKLGPNVRHRDRFWISFFNTDEIFAVAAAQPNLLPRYYFVGLAIPPYVGWALGTSLGALAGGILPSSVTSALGIAIYAMFVAIVLPPAKQSRAVCMALAIAVTLSCEFYYLPVLNTVSTGFVIIICGVIAAAVTAVVFPIKSEVAE